MSRRKSNQLVKKILFEIEEGVSHEEVRDIWEKILIEIPTLNDHILPEDCQLMFNLICKYVGGQEIGPLSNEFLITFAILIARTPAFAQFINKIKTKDFINKVNLIKYFQSLDPLTYHGAAHFLSETRKYCSNFQNYEAYLVEQPKNQDQILIKVDKLMAENQHESPDSFETWTDLIQSNDAIHQIKKENEMLKQIEFRYKLLYQSISEKDLEEGKKRRTELIKLYSDLKSHHHQQRKVKRDIFDEKKKQVLKNVQEDSKKLTDFIEQREKALESLEKVYSSIESISNYLNISSFLSIINQQILVLLELSVAISFCGLISTGKSSILNCFLGERFSPFRFDPMTAIPVRYVHANIKTPLLILPFYSELNILVSKMSKVDKDLLDHKINMEEEISNAHLLKLIREIRDNRMNFSRKYEGRDSIISITETVHDLFRLASLQQFDQANFLLPSDWRKGLDYMMTIYCPFKAFKSLEKDLVTLSLIDTPGIDEAGVKRLQLKKMLEETLVTCHLNCMISDMDRIESKDTVEFKQYLKKLGELQQTHLTLVINKADLIHSEDIPQFSEVVNNYLNLTSKDVFFVSARQYLYSYALENKNEITDSGLISEGEKYLRGIDEKNTSQTVKIIEDNSKVLDLQSHLNELAVRQGMNLCLNLTCNKVVVEGNKVIQKIDFMTNSSLVDEGRKKETLKKLEEKIELFETLIDVHKRECAQSKKDSKQKLTRIRDNILLQLRSLKEVISYESDQSQVLTEFLNSLQDEKEKNIFLTNSRTKFTSKKDLQLMLSRFIESLKNICKNYLQSRAQEDKSHFMWIEDTIQMTLVKLHSQVRESAKEVFRDMGQESQYNSFEIFPPEAQQQQQQQQQQQMELFEINLNPNFESQKLYLQRKGIFQASEEILNIWEYALIIFEYIEVDNNKIRETVISHVEKALSDSLIEMAVDQMVYKIEARLSDQPVQRLKELGASISPSSLEDSQQIERINDLKRVKPILEESLNNLKEISLKNKN